MKPDRQIVLEKLTHYLNNEISKQDVHEWALARAVERDFDKITQTDPLIGMTIQSLIDISHVDLKRIPSRRALEYYRLCLKGEMVFDPASADLESIVVSKGPEELERIEQIKQERAAREKKKYFILLRIYVIIFGLCSLGLNAVSALNPEFLRGSQDIPNVMGALIEALPHILYALLILLPREITAKEKIFYFSFPAFVFGMLYYWYLPVAIVTKLSLNFIFVFALLPISAIPATLAVYLLVLRREDLKWEKKA